MNQKEYSLVWRGTARNEENTDSPIGQLRKKIQQKQQELLTVSLCKEYGEDAEEVKFYLQYNTLGELHYLGLFFWYNIKFRQEEVKLYRNNYGRKPQGLTSNFGSLKDVLHCAENHVEKGENYQSNNGSLYCESYSTQLWVVLEKYCGTWDKQEGGNQQNCFEKIDKAPPTNLEELESQLPLMKEDWKTVVKRRMPEYYSKSVELKLLSGIKSNTVKENDKEFSFAQFLLEKKGDWTQGNCADFAFSVDSVRPMGTDRRKLYIDWVENNLQTSGPVLSKFTLRDKEVILAENLREENSVTLHLYSMVEYLYFLYAYVIHYCEKRQKQQKDLIEQGKAYQDFVDKLDPNKSGKRKGTTLQSEVSKFIECIDFEKEIIDASTMNAKQQYSNDFVAQWLKDRDIAQFHGKEGQETEQENGWRLFAFQEAVFMTKVLLGRLRKG